MKSVLFICIAALFSLSTSDFPVPPHTKKSLFYIHRNLNNHSVVYEVNLTDKGIIDPENPFRIYWLRVGEKNKYRELNYMERTFAYGLKTQAKGHGRYRANFVAKKERSIDVYLDEKGQATALMNIDNKISKLVKIFVQVAEDGWWPKVAYVEFFGTDFKTNLPTYEKLLIE
jgi:Domain of unknown function (DUF4833)